MQEPRLLLVSRDLYLEYNARKKEIEKLKNNGEHPAVVRVERKALNTWVMETRESGMAGFWPVVIAT